MDVLSAHAIFVLFFSIVLILIRVSRAIVCFSLSVLFTVFVERERDGD